MNFKNQVDLGVNQYKLELILIWERENDIYQLANQRFEFGLIWFYQTPYIVYS